MRSREVKVLRRGNDLLEFTPEIMAFLQEPRPLIVATFPNGKRAVLSLLSCTSNGASCAASPAR